jgi:hypothetical protein
MNADALGSRRTTSNAPVATGQTAGRTFGTDWSIANVVTLLRSHAARGMWRRDFSTGGYTAKINETYVRAVSARHLPTSVSLIFMQMEDCWYASICFCADGGLLPWNSAIAEQWLCALFGRDRIQVQSSPEGADTGNRGARQFTLKRESAAPPAL